MPARRSSADHAVELLHLPPGEGPVLIGVTVGHREVRPQPLQPEQRLVGDGAHEGGDGGGLGPDAVHPGVHLHVDRRRLAPAPRRAGELLDALGGVERGREPVGQCGVDGVGAALAQEEDGTPHVMLAQLDALVDQCHGQLRRPSGQRGARRRRAAVPVAVRLDDGAEPGRLDQPGQHPGVVGDGRQVDLGPGRSRVPLRHRPRVRPAGRRGPGRQGTRGTVAQSAEGTFSHGGGPR